MDANTTARFHNKVAQAVATLEATQAKALKLAQAGTTNADSWASYANELASDDGRAYAYLRVQMTVNYFDRKGKELTDAAFLDALMDLVTEGANDSWSGRGNDVRRARFDGILKAAKEMKYLVTT